MSDLIEKAKSITYKTEDPSIINIVRELIAEVDRKNWGLEMKKQSVWIVEYNWTNGWGQTPEDNDGNFLTYRTKREANSDLSTGKYSGHPSDLRVRKYVREKDE